MADMTDGAREEEQDYPFRAGHITVSYPPGPANNYTLRCLLPAIEQGLPEWTISSDLDPAGRLGSIQWSDYDRIDWAALKSFPQETLFNAYPIRKALIRKNYLIKAVEAYAVKKRPVAVDEAGLHAITIPKSYPFTLSFSDELDELWADELYELADELNSNLSRQADQPKKVWILKPALADKAQGIRLFSSREELYEIFTEFERLEELLEEQSQELDDQQQDGQGANDEQRQTWVSVSQMRDWIIQEYISNPLLIDPAKPETYSIDQSIDRSSFRKHHLRVYVLAVGALSVYVFEDILSLFSSKAYTLEDLTDLRVHLTNTCLQESLSSAGGGAGRSTGERPQVTVSIGSHPVQVLDQIDSILANLFSFVAQNDPINFQLNPNCFELFGIDFLVDQDLKVWLLEINAGPDFSQTGDDLKLTIDRLFKGTIAVLKSEVSLLSRLSPLADQRFSKAEHAIPSPSRPAPSNTSSGDLPPRLRYPQELMPFRKVLELQTAVSFR